MKNIRNALLLADVPMGGRGSKGNFPIIEIKGKEKSVFTRSGGRPVLEEADEKRKSVASASVRRPSVAQGRSNTVGAAKRRGIKPNK